MSSQHQQDAQTSYTYTPGLISSAPHSASSVQMQQQQQGFPGLAQPCFCVMLGQPCTCSRPRANSLQQQYTGGARSYPVASSSRSGIAIGVRPPQQAAQSQYTYFSPVHLHHPNARQRSNTTLSLEPASMAAAWVRDTRMLPAGYPDEGVTPTSAHPHTLNLSQQQQRFANQPMTLQQESMVDPSPPFSQPQQQQQQQLGGYGIQPEQVSYPSLAYLYESLPSSSAPAADPSAFAAPSAGLGSGEGGPHEGAMNPASLDFEFGSSSRQSSISGSLSRSSFWAMEGALPRWTSRPSTSGSAYSMDQSVSQMSLSSSSHGFSDSFGAGPSTPAASGMVGFGHNRYLSDTTQSIGSASLGRKTGTEESDTGSSTIGVPSPSYVRGSGSSNIRSGISNVRFGTEDARWNAVVNRSHSADGHFVYGALTTRIYCRPSCASKRPDRNRIAFFDFPDAPTKAEHAGFRACKRCKPGTPGTADLCVLAVGQCLRHITQAALLGESDEVDVRLKRRTLKEYSSDYGVSAFHFHRTLKNVCTLTPGDYSKACHALVLQDEIGMDKHNGRQLDENELQRRLRGWSARRARRAVGNILPSTYANGFPGLKMYCIYAPNTLFGHVAILYSRGEEASMAGTSPDGMVAHPLDVDVYSRSNCTVFATLICDDALARARQRAPNAVQMPGQVQWLRSLVEDLSRKALREVQMPAEVIPWVRRARVWLAVRNALEPKLKMAGKRASISGGEDDDEEEEDDDDDAMGVSKMSKSLQPAATKVDARSSTLSIAF